MYTTRTWSTSAPGAGSGSFLTQVVPTENGSSSSLGTPSTQGGRDPYSNITTGSVYATLEKGGNTTFNNATMSSIVMSEGTETVRQISDKWTEILHSLAVVSLIVSILFSLGTVLYLFLSDRRISFWRRKIAERLVVYLALCDLLYSTEHVIDHMYILIVGEFPPEAMCTALGFLLQEFATLQGILVVFTALNAFSLVVREKGFVTGRYDWRLISVAIGMPVMMGITLLVTDMLGPSEAWCFTDKRKDAAIYVDMVYAFSFVTIFLINIVCYGMVWYKIRKVSNLVSTYQKEESSSVLPKNSNLKAARTMCIFIVAYIAQWFGYMTYSIWSLLQPAPIWLLGLTVVVTNMGGVFNCVAYTWLRKNNRQNSESSSDGQSRYRNSQPKVTHSSSKSSDKF